MKTRYEYLLDEMTKAVSRAEQRDEFVEARDRAGDYTGEEWQHIIGAAAANTRQLWVDVCTVFAGDDMQLFDTEFATKVYGLCRAQLLDGEDVPGVLSAVRRAYEDGDHQEPWPRNDPEHVRGWEECLDRISEFLSASPAASTLSPEALLHSLIAMVAPLKLGVDVGPDWISKSTFRDTKGVKQIAPHA